MDRSGRSTAQRLSWRRIALGAAALAGVLALGKSVPLAGLDTNTVAEVVQVCTNGGGGNFWSSLLISCPGPYLPHKELGGNALLGGTALVVFATLLIRRRLRRH